MLFDFLRGGNLEANEHYLGHEQICFPMLAPKLTLKSVTLTGPPLAGGQTGLCEHWSSSCRKWNPLGSSEDTQVLLWDVAWSLGLVAIFPRGFSRTRVDLPLMIRRQWDYRRQTLPPAYLMPPRPSSQLVIPCSRERARKERRNTNCLTIWRAAYSHPGRNVDVKTSGWVGSEDSL